MVKSVVAGTQQSLLVKLSVVRQCCIGGGVLSIIIIIPTTEIVCHYRLIFTEARFCQLHIGLYLRTLRHSSGNNSREDVHRAIIRKLKCQGNFRRFRMHSRAHRWPIVLMSVINSSVQHNALMVRWRWFSCHKTSCLTKINGRWSTSRCIIDGIL